MFYNIYAYLYDMYVVYRYKYLIYIFYVYNIVDCRLRYMFLPIRILVIKVILLCWIGWNDGGWIFLRINTVNHPHTIYRTDVFTFRGDHDHCTNIVALRYNNFIYPLRKPFVNAYACKAPWTSMNVLFRDDLSWKVT